MATQTTEVPQMSPACERAAADLLALRSRLERIDERVQQFADRLQDFMDSLDRMCDRDMPSGIRLREP